MLLSKEEIVGIVDAADNSGFTSLHYAVREGHLEIVEELVRHGADVEKMNVVGKSPMRYARSKEMKDALLEGLDLHKKTHSEH